MFNFLIKILDVSNDHRFMINKDDRNFVHFCFFRRSDDFEVAYFCLEYKNNKYIFHGQVINSRCSQNELKLAETIKEEFNKLHDGVCYDQ